MLTVWRKARASSIATRATSAPGSSRSRATATSITSVTTAGPCQSLRPRAGGGHCARRWLQLAEARDHQATSARGSSSRLPVEQRETVAGAYYRGRSLSELAEEQGIHARHRQVARASRSRACAAGSLEKVEPMNDVRPRSPRARRDARRIRRGHVRQGHRSARDRVPRVPVQTAVRRDACAMRSTRSAAPTLDAAAAAVGAGRAGRRSCGDSWRASKRRAFLGATAMLAPGQSRRRPSWSSCSRRWACRKCHPALRRPAFRRPASRGRGRRGRRRVAAPRPRDHAHRSARGRIGHGGAPREPQAGARDPPARSRRRRVHGDLHGRARGRRRPLRARGHLDPRRAASATSSEDVEGGPRRAWR